jgi:hypothetical protein
MTQVQDGPGLPRTSEEVLSMVRGREQRSSSYATLWAIRR